MKKRLKIIIGLGTLCAGALILGACGVNNSPYKDWAEQGYDFSVCYDANGGKIMKNDTKVVDTYPSEAVKKGVKLFAPDDPRRGGSPLNVDRNGYFLAGWYAKREPRVDADGTPLDEEGNPCTEERDLLDAGGNPVYDEDGNVQKTYYSECGKPQGYTYSEKWDFDSLRYLDDFEYQEGEYALTLYAAWVPNFGYELQGETQQWECTQCGTTYDTETKPDVCRTAVGDADEKGEIPVCGSTSFKDNGFVWAPIATYEFNPTLSVEDMGEQPIPTWNEATGVLDYGNFEAPADKTFLSAYATKEDCGNETNPLTSFKNDGTWDEDTATATHNIARFYVKWEKGLWYRVYNKEQLAANAGMGRSYDLFGDLRFEETDVWPAALSGNVFSGTFRGNGHTISGVTVHQTNAQDVMGGLFGSISAAATIENVTFENITYSFEAASTTTGSSFGLFAGVLDPSATIKDVKISGIFLIKDSIYIPRPGYDYLTGQEIPALFPYELGLLTGNLVTGGLSLAGITLQTEGVNASVADSQTGEIKIG